jgi:hypothetical protein
MKRATAMNGKAIEAERRSPASAALSPESKGREIVADIVNSAVEKAMFGEAERSLDDGKRAARRRGAR